MISRGASLGAYEGPLRDCVMALKYRGRHKTAERLAGRLFADARCRSILHGVDALVGIPLHIGREQERGFNQAVLIVKALARMGPVPTSCALVRVLKTQSQTRLSARDRRRNVSKAFAVKSDHSFQGAVVVLVDDVITTGATIRECAKTLLAHGAREVRAITVARAE